MAVFDIGGIKDFIKATFDANNAEDQLGSPAPDYYLSTGMIKPVKKVVTVNPEDIKPMANVMPCVAINFEHKAPTGKDIAVDQVKAKRQAISTFVITGMVWNQNFQANIFDDPADRDLEKLMENIEELLRYHPTLNGLCKWQQPGSVSYHTANFKEQAHFRVAFMELKVTHYY